MIVHSNKKTVVYYEFPPANRHPTRATRYSLQFAMDIWQRFQMPTPAPPADGPEWIGIGGARLSTGVFRSA
jgi:hypothetical protein